MSQQSRIHSNHTPTNQSASRKVTKLPAWADDDAEVFPTRSAYNNHSAADSLQSTFSNTFFRAADSLSDAADVDLSSSLAASDDSDFEIIDASEVVAAQESSFGEETPYRAFVRKAEVQAARRRSRINSEYNGFTTMEPDNSNDYNSPEWQQAGHNADETDLAGPGAHGKLECTVTRPQKEGEGTQNAYISYLVSTEVCMCTSGLALR